MPTLPFELIEDILRRLPVKSLKRFRAVAKSWCSLIDNQNFIKLHYRQSLISASHLNLIIEGLSLHNGDMEALDEAPVINPPFYFKKCVYNVNMEALDKAPVIKPPFDYKSDPPVLWNIFSREYSVLPRCSSEMEAPFGSFGQTKYGFGYDSVNDDYKVIRIAEFRHEMSHIWMASETKIYGLTSNSWRRIEDFPYPVPSLRRNWRVHVNGALHTLVQDPEDSGSVVIMAFNVQTEKHTPIMMPPRIRIRGIDVSLDMIDGCLSVVCTGRKRIVIWVMKEYGVRDSWFKLLTISSSLIKLHNFVRPLAYSKDRKRVLLHWDDRSFVWYYLGVKSVKGIGVEGLPFVVYAEVCVETLITLNGGVEVKRKARPEAKKKEKIRSKRVDDFLSEGFKLVL